MCSAEISIFEMPVDLYTITQEKSNVLKCYILPYE